MSNYPRGRVTKVTFAIEYPDGSTASSTVTDTQDLTGIVFTDEGINNDAVDRYNASTEDWKKNPTMLLQYASPRESGEYFTLFCSKDSHCED